MVLDRMSPIRIPLSTYRLQFNHSFTFSQAAELVSYLSELGISHCYASPYLRSRPGSLHGYDIIDHHTLNPEIGTPEEYNGFVAALHGRGMGQILDIVPNHMGIMGADNAWWLDVLENGEASANAGFFDIDWYPIKDELQRKVLVPVLGDQYGTVLDRGELQLRFDQEKAEFSIFYFEHRFPIDPREYPRILGYRLELLQQRLGEPMDSLLELQSLQSAFSHLPGRDETAPEKIQERSRDKEIHKRRLAQLCARAPEVAQFLEENTVMINGIPGDSASFEFLHDLIKAQAYRLAYWRVSADDINYRRFFDIDDLAALRQENGAAFRGTHEFVFELLRQGKIDGFRVDHPD
ncbi:MAG: malto-oligosyltrehalose synthase, partial [Acidobacteria bacterium]|nr:malto-oligosyltrehalose synthase [Acidobacteriota bacterium]